MRITNLLQPACIVAALAAPAAAQQVAVEELRLENGMTFLLVERREEPASVACAWVARVGSVHERPGITGLAHFLERMLAAGTTTIGTRDADAEAAVRARIRAARAELVALTWNDQYARHRRGQIDDPWDPAFDTPRMAELRSELDALMDEHRALVVPDELASRYAEAGARDLDAFTTHDLTCFMVTMPANKLELWAWLESDRLLDAVLRGFHAERDVVDAERRKRLEASPTAPLDEQFDAMLWTSMPYAWPVIGWPSDLHSYTVEQAESFLATHYAPGNLVGVLVGDFNADAIRPVLTEYFGRLEAAAPPPPVVTLEVPQRGERRLIGTSDGPRQVRIAYHAVPFGHADAAPLALLAELLDGPAGRLRRILVERDALAVSAAARLDTRRYAGVLEFRAEAQGSTPLAAIEDAWSGQVRLLRNDPVPDAELARVRARVIADALRGLRSNADLRLRLALDAGRGDASALSDRIARIEAVTSEDILRVARRYLRPDNRTVGHFDRRADARPSDPEFDALPPDVQVHVQTLLGRLLTKTDPAELEMIIAAMRTQIAATPEEHRPAIAYVIKRLEQRRASLGGGS